MYKEINKILEISKSLQVTASQGLFLLAVSENIFEIDISGEELLDLVERRLFVGRRIPPEILNKITNLKSGVEMKSEVKKENPNLQSYPKLTRQTGELVKLLARNFLTDYTENDHEKMYKYFRNPEAGPYLHIFLGLFPTSNKKRNKLWEKHFGENASGVTLRRLTNGTARKFQQIWKTKDMGLFLMGTYMFILESYNMEDRKYYVKKIENYMAEWDYWYDLAEEQLTSGGFKELFTPTTTRKGHQNTTVI